MDTSKTADKELEFIMGRLSAGMKARLKSGKVGVGPIRFGYKRVGDKVEIEEDQARWVRQIYYWHNQGVTVSEIRNRLIEANAAQNKSPKRKTPWSISAIRQILNSAESYASGVKHQTWRGETYEIKITPILDEETYQKFLEVRASNNQKRTRHNIDSEF